VGEAVEEVVSAREEVLYTHIETENQLTQRTLTLTLTLADLFLFSDLLRFHRRGHLILDLGATPHLHLHQVICTCVGRRRRRRRSFFT